MAMTMIINLTQHSASPAQLAQGVVDVTDRQLLSELLTFDAAELAALRPEDQQREMMDKVLSIIDEFVYPHRAEPGLAVMIGGAPYLMGPLEDALIRRGVRVCYALSERVSTEVTQPDGSIRKVSDFVHVGFYWAS